MKPLISLLVISTILVGCIRDEKISLADARRVHRTNLIYKETAGFPVEIPSPELDLVQYPTALGQLPAYISKPVSRDEKHPAIIWIVGGFGNSISEVAWSPSPVENDQSATVFRKKGIITMYPSLRGGNENPGYIENLYGEVDDIVSAYKYLQTLDYVDPDRIYLGGHSTGGTLALLVAETFAQFRAVFSFGPVDRVSRYGQESLVYDVQDKTEDELRAPVQWLHLIQNPTFVFEGTDGGSNVDCLHLLRKRCRNNRITFIPLPGHDHYSGILPVSNLIADKILKDTGPHPDIDFTLSELSGD